MTQDRFIAPLLGQDLDRGRLIDDIALRDTVGSVMMITSELFTGGKGV